MTFDQEERAIFKEILRKCSLTGIQRALDDHTINLPWKRDLAEDEPARRSRVTATEKEFSVEVASRKKSIAWNVRKILALLIIAVVLFTVVSVFQLWH